MELLFKDTPIGNIKNNGEIQNICLPAIYEDGEIAFRYN